MHVFRNRSVKARITLWYTGFITIIVVFLVGALVISEGISSQDYYVDQLQKGLAQVAEGIASLQDAQAIDLQLDSGVHMSALQDDGTLLAGTRTFRINPHEDKLRIRSARDDDFWYLLDKPVDLDDGTRIWLRAFISSAVSERNNRAIMLFLLVAIPLLLFISVFGGLWLTRRAFGPLDAIIHAAQGISNATDLKQRLPVDTQSDEVGQLSSALNGMLSRLERSIEDEKGFISDASHELRTPISVISAQSEFALLPERTPEEKEAALRIIQARSVNAGRMLSQLLLLSRMDYEKLPLNIERVDLSELLEQIALESAEKAGNRGISIHTQIEQGIHLDCDELLIMRMIDNLLENAMRYGLNGGNIWIDLSRSGGSILLRIRDDGIGISEKDQSKIWQRFYQVNKSEQREVGFGLGLSMVHWIVTAHGGEISVRSALGEGSCFTVTLPEGVNVTRKPEIPAQPR